MPSPPCRPREPANAAVRSPMPSSPIATPCRTLPGRSWGFSLKSTSCEEVARQVLADCIAGRPPKSLPLSLLQDPCARALFGVLVEGLADRFDPDLCEIYARLFSAAFPGADLA